MDKIQRMKKWMAIVVVVALALNGLLSATAYATGGPDLFRVRNSNGPGGDHGYMKVTYNGNTVNLDRGEETTFIYVPGAGNVSIDFVPDTNWAFDYYVIGNGATHINTDPTLINPSSYAGRPGDNNRISVNPKWEAIHSYTVTWKNYNNTQLEQDTNVPSGTTPTYNGATPTRPATAEFTYTFSGWSPAVAAVTGDITYTAQFTATKNAYDVTWKNYNNTQLEKDEDVLYGTTPTYNGATPTRPATAEFTYTFSGWSPAVSAVTGNITYTAQFTATKNAYDVTWKNYNNTQLEKDEDVLYGTTPTYNGATPTRPATAEFTYTFSGWSPAVSAVTGDITYTAQFTAVTNAYDVTWKNYNNTQLEKDEDVLYGTTPTYNGATPTRPATAEFTYTFSGWSPAVSAVTGDITYTAQFTAVTNAYDVTWNNFDNSELEKDEDVPYGAAPTYDSATPTKPATAEFTYTFSGWSPAVSAVTGDITYTAQFTAVTNAYNVTWNNYDNSELEKDEDVLYGATPTYNGATPIKPATAEFTYTFSGWSPAVSVVTGDITYTAQFTAVTNAYDVRFVDYNGTVLKTESVLYGNSATAPANPNNQTGYHFTGWDVSFNPVTGNLTVTAQYAINTYIVRFFRADGVTQIGAAQTINWGTAAVLENAPARTGFAFAGWSLTGDDAAVATSLLNVRENIDAVAGYNPLVFVVRFEDFDGTLLGTDEVQYGDDATAPGAPTREGYDFTGWSPSYDTVTGNMTVVAEYTIQTFTVTFVNFDGTVIDTQTVDWNTGATAPEVPQRDGFEFTGWDRAFDPVTSDITVTAQFGEIAAPAPEPTVIPDDEPVPTTGGGVSPLWWLLLIPGLGLLIWLLLAWLSIVPIAEAVSDNGDGTMTIQWGYENRKGRTKKIDEEDSQLTALAGSVIRNSQEPPFEFEKGRVENVFTTVAAVGSKIQWKIKNRKANVDLSKANK